MKNRFIILSVLIFFAAGTAAGMADYSYWDLFKVPVHQPEYNADITINTESLIPIADFSKNMEFGGGGTIGMHWQLGGWRLGFETGGWLLFGSDSNNENDSDRPIDYLVMAPLYGVFGYKFSPYKWLSIIPTIGIGASFDVLKYIEGGASPLGAEEKTEIWNIHQIGRAGLQVWFNFFSRVPLFLGTTYTASIEYQDFSVGQFLSFQLGATWLY